MDRLELWLRVEPSGEIWLGNFGTVFYAADTLFRPV